MGYIRGTSIKIIKEFTSGVHSKHKAGGQSQARFERLMKEAEKRFYRRVAVYFNNEFVTMEKLQGIFVGGAGNSKLSFVSDKTIDYRLRPKILNTIDLPYDGGYEGIRALVNKTTNQMKEVRYIQEKNIVQKFMKELSKDTGLALYGHEEIKKALIHEAVNTLIIAGTSKKNTEIISEINDSKVKIEFISTETESGEMIHKSFGGIVAIARYKLLMGNY